MDENQTGAVDSNAELCWTLCEALRADYLRRLRVERARLDGFVRYGNELKRAAALDRMISDVERLGCQRNQHNAELK